MMVEFLGNFIAQGATPKNTDHELHFGLGAAFPTISRCCTKSLLGQIAVAPNPYCVKSLLRQILIASNRCWATSSLRQILIQLLS